MVLAAGERRFNSNYESFFSGKNPPQGSGWMELGVVLEFPNIILTAAVISPLRWALSPPRSHHSLRHVPPSLLRGRGHQAITDFELRDSLKLRNDLNSPILFIRQM